MTTLAHEAIEDVDTPAGVDFYTKGLVLPHDYPFESYLALMDQLAVYEAATQWWIGDALNAGEYRYGDKYAQAISPEQAKSWRTYAWVAAKVEMSMRMDNLTWSHHQTVAALEPDEQRRWLQEADEEGYTYAQLRRAIKHERILGSVEAFPEGKHRVIYADPPWEYGDVRGFDGYEATAATDQYPTMSKDELCALQVPAIAADDAVLFCWATFPLLPDALEVVTAWEFEYKTALVWDKERANLGNYHNASAELLLVCTRGSCTPDADEREDQVQSIPRTARHSEKPEEFRELIDRLYPHGPRIELFRRGAAPDGWKVWGNESE